MANGRGLVVAREMAGRLGSFTQDRAGKRFGAGTHRKRCGVVVKMVLFPELIGQVRQVRNVPVVMVERKVVEDRNGGSVLLKQNLTRAIRQILNSYLGSEFL